MTVELLGEPVAFVVLKLVVFMSYGRWGTKPAYRRQRGVAIAAFHGVVWSDSSKPADFGHTPDFFSDSRLFTDRLYNYIRCLSFIYHDESTMTVTKVLDRIER